MTLCDYCKIAEKRHNEFGTEFIPCRDCVRSNKSTPYYMSARHFGTLSENEKTHRCRCAGCEGPLWCGCCSGRLPSLDYLDDETEDVRQEPGEIELLPEKSPVAQMLPYDAECWSCGKWLRKEDIRCTGCAVSPADIVAAVRKDLLDCS